MTGSEGGGGGGGGGRGGIAWECGEVRLWVRAEMVRYDGDWRFVVRLEDREATHGCSGFLYATDCVDSAIHPSHDPLTTYVSRFGVLLAASTASVSPFPGIVHNAEVRANIQPGSFYDRYFYVPWDLSLV